MSADASPGSARRARSEQTNATDEGPDAVRALEFYCGVGGLHFSLLRARPNGDARVVGAFDINPNACDVYEANFGTRPIANSLSAVPAAKLDAFNSSLWLMSPPCQPFTRQGSQRDASDARSESFESLAFGGLAGDAAWRASLRDADSLQKLRKLEREAKPSWFSRDGNDRKAAAAKLDAVRAKRRALVAETGRSDASR